MDIPPQVPEDEMTPDDLAEFWAWELVELTGWTLDYIDTLPIEQIHHRMQLADAKAKFRKYTHGN